MFRLIFTTSIAFITILFYQCNSSSESADEHQLAMNFCIVDSSSLTQCNNCQSARIYHFNHYWIDTSRQFFVKILEFEEGPDTLFVSVTDGLDEKELTRGIHNQTDSTISSEWFSNTNYRQFSLLGHHAGRYLIRYVYMDKAFDDFMVMDLPIKDSTRAYQYFKNRTIPQHIELCL